MPAAAARGAAVLMEPMLPGDLDDVLAIEHKSFSTPWTDTMFLSELRQGPASQLLVARLEKRPTTIAGYVGYRAVLDEMHIMIIAVAPAWRRRGIAQHMLSQAMEQARQAACARAILEVRASNIGAQQLYFRLGFAPVGVRPKYYTRPSEDALILWRDPL
ncbi:MAG: ribosomal protein S18-alanine N-acetyltransferase [Candidatus Tectomicrobia bacterium]|nr:ribosomal protein S18-alanine N-acetyltransferase [Candidatus Tectomicrobia bacterium]